MPKDALARGAKSASFGHSAGKDEPIEFHGTVAAAQEPELMVDANGNHPNQMEWHDPSHDNFIAKCIPLNGRVLLKRVDIKKDGAVVEPDQYAAKSNKGEIVALPLMMLNNALHVGDHVLFGEYNAEEIKLDGEDFLLLDSHDIRLKLPR